MEFSQTDRCSNSQIEHRSGTDSLEFGSCGKTDTTGRGDTLHRHRCTDVWVGMIVFQRKVLVTKSIDVINCRIQTHGRP